MKRFLERLIPVRARIPLVTEVVINLLAFYLTRVFTSSAVHHDFTLGIDAKIPFLPVFILFYFAAYLQWGLSFLVAARDEEDRANGFFFTMTVSKVIAAVFFILLPTAMMRPEVTGGDFFSALVRFIYSVDSPDNLFPSIHCLESWICFRYSLKRSDKLGFLQVLHLVLTLGVFASTVLVKQHVAVDIAAGVAVAEASILITSATKGYRLFSRINNITVSKVLSYEKK